MFVKETLMKFLIDKKIWFVIKNEEEQESGKKRKESRKDTILSSAILYTMEL